MHKVVYLQRCGLHNLSHGKHSALETGPSFVLETVYNEKVCLHGNPFSLHYWSEIL